MHCACKVISLIPYDNKTVKHPVQYIRKQGGVQI